MRVKAIGGPFRVIAVPDPRSVVRDADRKRRLTADQSQ
jgi:hypothetical protein